MRMQFVVLAAAIACRSEKASPPGETIEVRSAGVVVERISIANTDLWQWCDDGVASVVARADSAFVVGSCAQREAQTFRITRASDGTAAATLTRSADGAVLSRAQP